MIIAIYAGNAYPKKMFRDCFEHLVHHHPDCGFVFLVSKKEHPFTKAPNASFHEMTALEKLRMPSLLRKKNATHFISLQPIHIKTPGIKQIAWLTDYHLKPAAAKAWLTYPQPACIAYPGIYQALEEKGAIRPILTYFGLGKKMPPLNYEEREAAQDAWAGGSPYICYPIDSASNDTIVLALKAFSQFKQWLKTSAKFLLLHEGDKTIANVPQLSSYKYRNDVLIKPYNSDTQRDQMLGGSICNLLLDDGEAAVRLGIRAMQLCTPVVSVDTFRTRAGFHDAALFVTTEPGTISQALNLVYKNESTAKSFSLQGIENSQPYSWQHCGDVLWKSLTSEPVV